MTGKACGWTVTAWWEGRSVQEGCMGWGLHRSAGGSGKASWRSRADPRPPWKLVEQGCSMPRTWPEVTGRGGMRR